MVSPLGQPGCPLVRLTSLSRDGDSVARGDGGRAGPATSGQGRRKDQTGGNEPTILARCGYSALRGRRRPTVRRPRSVLQRSYPLITPRSCFRSRRACTCRGRRRGAERGLRHADPGLGGQQFDQRDVNMVDPKPARSSHEERIRLGIHGGSGTLLHVFVIVVLHPGFANARPVPGTPPDHTRPAARQHRPATTTAVAAPRTQPIPDIPIRNPCNATN